jgi:hypothetical protein
MHEVRPAHGRLTPPADIAWLQGRLLQGVLFLTVLISPLVFIEPSPYEAAIALLALTCVIAGVRIDRKLLPMVVLLLLWNFGGALALMPVADDSDAVTYSIVSFYLAINAVIFACLATENTERRLATIRTAYILAAFVAAVLGIIGYFQIAAPDLLMQNSRARATFKDPNVFGPYLVLPLLFLIQLVLYRGLRLRYVVGGGVILAGLFLSFSRGAWGHFVLSALVMIALMLLTAPSRRFRARILMWSALAGLGIVVFLGALLSVEAVQVMFADRATLIKEYDAGEGGRFGNQARGLYALFNYPNGVGPLQYARHFGFDPHNDYLNAFFSYGWLGGLVYPTLVLVTLAVGFRALLVRTPWQAPLVAIYATYFGLVCEGLIIGTDHWRHYYLLLGLIWGLAAATINARRNAEGMRA